MAAIPALGLHQKTGPLQGLWSYWSFHSHGTSNYMSRYSIYKSHSNHHESCRSKDWGPPAVGSLTLMVKGQHQEQNSVILVSSITSLL